MVNRGSGVYSVHSSLPHKSPTTERGRGCVGRGTKIENQFEDISFIVFSLNRDEKTQHRSQRCPIDFSLTESFPRLGNS